MNLRQIYESEGADQYTREISDLAKRHGVSAREIHSQLTQGIEVEKEHTNNVSMAAKIALDHLSERPDYYTMLKNAESKPSPGLLLEAFMRFVVQRLGLDTLPKIRFSRSLDSRITTHPTFGYFDPETDEIKVSVGGRHIMDIFRTLAHELIHHKQRLQNQIDTDSGNTGSPQENQANALAGQFMRDFADLEPESFGVKDVAEDLTQKAKPGSRPGSLRRKAGKKKGEKITASDLERMKSRANRMKKSSNADTRKRGVQLGRQVNWYRNFHK